LLIYLATPPDEAIAPTCLEHVENNAHVKYAGQPSFINNFAVIACYLPFASKGDKKVTRNYGQITWPPFECAQGEYKQGGL
jgi:hypothetical protein